MQKKHFSARILFLPNKMVNPKYYASFDCFPRRANINHVSGTRKYLQSYQQVEENI